MCRRCGIPWEEEVCTITDRDGDLYGTCCKVCADELHEIIELSKYTKVSDCADMLTRLQVKNAMVVRVRE